MPRGVYDRMYVTEGKFPGISVLELILVYLYFVLYNRGNCPMGYVA